MLLFGANVVIVYFVDVVMCQMFYLQLSIHHMNFKPLAEERLYRHGMYLYIPTILLSLFMIFQRV